MQLLRELQQLLWPGSLMQLLPELQQLLWLGSLLQLLLEPQQLPWRPSRPQPRELQEGPLFQVKEQPELLVPLPQSLGLREQHQ